MKEYRSVGCIRTNVLSKVSHLFEGMPLTKLLLGRGK